MVYGIVLPTLVVIRGATTTTWSTSTQYLKTSISKQHCIGGRARRNHQRAAWHSWRLCCSLDDQGRDVAATKGWWLRGINGLVYGKIAGNHGFFMVFRDFDYWIWGFQQIFSGLVVSFTRLIFRLWKWDDDPQWLSFFHGGWTQPEMGDVLVFIINSRLHRLPGAWDFGWEKNFNRHRKQPPRRRLRPAGHMGMGVLEALGILRAFVVVSCVVRASSGNLTWQWKTVKPFSWENHLQSFCFNVVLQFSIAMFDKLKRGWRCLCLSTFCLFALSKKTNTFLSELGDAIGSSAK